MTNAMVLLVEDEREIRRFVRHALEQEGLRVLEAETRREGLLEAARERAGLGEAVLRPPQLALQARDRVGPVLHAAGVIEQRALRAHACPQRVDGRLGVVRHTLRHGESHREGMRLGHGHGPLRRIEIVAGEVRMTQVGREERGAELDEVGKAAHRRDRRRQAKAHHRPGRRAPRGGRVPVEVNGFFANYWRPR